MDQTNWDTELRLFLRQWMYGLFRGFETQSEEIQSAILNHCGSACAHPQASIFFQEAWDDASDLDCFLKILNEKYCSDTFKLNHDGSIQVEYSKCYCPLHQRELVNSSLLQKCGQAWLKEVFQSTVNSRVNVEGLESICTGGKTCNFLIHFSKEQEHIINFQSYLKDSMKIKIHHYSDKNRI